jgi:hypothetical protein
MGTTLYGDPALSLYPISNPPEKPSNPDGHHYGRIKIKHMYTTSSIEPDGDQIRYLFDWGDENTTITEYYSSGETVGTSYKWNEQGTFNIRVRAQDEYGAWSDWSDSLPVSMSKIKIVSENSVFIRILENYPHLFPLIQQLLGLEI